MNYAELGFTPGDTSIPIRRNLSSGKGVASFSDILPNNVELFEILIGKKGADLKSVHKKKRSGIVIRTIFKSALDIIFERIIKGDVFIAPSGDEIYVRALPDSIVKKLRQAGHFSDVDIVKAQFTLPEVVYSMRGKSRTRLISLPKRFRDKMFRNIESGALKLVRVVMEKIL